MFIMNFIMNANIAWHFSKRRRFLESCMLQGIKCGKDS